MTEEPNQTIVTVNSLDLCLYEWQGTGTPLVFVHANSFHARCWDEVIKLLPGQHCYAFDQRGHGRSDKPAPPYHWRQFGEDLAALTRELGLRGAVGIGHSLGGHATTLAAALNPGAFAALLLIDPVILRRSLYTGERMMGEHFAARRRNRSTSPHEMYERFKDRPPFASWQPAVLRDYCEYGLLPAPDGDGFELACPPQIEADIYMAVAEDDIYPQIATVQAPTLVVRGGRYQTNPAADLSASPTAPELASFFARGEDIHLLDASHFIPMEAPERVAGYVRQLLSL